MKNLEDIKNSKDLEFWKECYKLYLKNNAKSILEELNINIDNLCKIFKKLGFKNKLQTQLEERDKRDILFEELSKKYIKAQITRKEILETLKITETEFFSRMRRKGYLIKTYHYSKKIGYVRRDDTEFWRKFHSDWYNGLKSLKEVADEVGVDIKFLVTNFRKLNFPNPEKEKTEKLKVKKLQKKNLEKYGTENFFKTKEFKEKFSKTSLENWGVDHPFKSKKVQEKLKKTWSSPESILKRKNSTEIIKLKNQKKALIRINRKLEKDNFLLMEDYEGLRKNKIRILYKIKHLECGTIFEDDLIYKVRCPKCHIIHGSSKAERDLRDFIKTNCETEVIFNSKKIIPSKKTEGRHYQIDYYIPNLKIAFEYNGMYYHSTLFKTTKDYHKYKTEEALKNGVKLYHIWELEDLEVQKKRIKKILSGEKVDIYFEQDNLIKVDRDWCPDYKDSIFYNSNEFLGYSEPVLVTKYRYNYYTTGYILFKK